MEPRREEKGTAEKKGAGKKKNGEEKGISSLSF
jgi:hypothetical protein